jgi:hypothetical protein
MDCSRAHNHSTGVVLKTALCLPRLSTAPWFGLRPTGLTELGETDRAQPGHSPGQGTVSRSGRRPRRVSTSSESSAGTECPHLIRENLRESTSLFTNSGRRMLKRFTFVSSLPASRAAKGALLALLRTLSALDIVNCEGRGFWKKLHEARCAVHNPISLNEQVGGPNRLTPTRHPSGLR